MKSLIKTSLAVFMLAVISCSKEPLPNQPVANSQTENQLGMKLPIHYIGERFGGGVVFYTDSAGRHGIIADTVDLAPAKWSNGSMNVLTGANEVLIGTGKTNTNKIVLKQGSTGNYAALECKNSNRSGFIDWYLPSLRELQQLHIQQAVVGGFTGT